MRGPGEILLVSTYELGHQPLNLASPLAYLARAGYAPAAVDTAVAPLADEAIARARLVAISVPMHTALRLGVEVARRVRAGRSRTDHQQGDCQQDRKRGAFHRRGSMRGSPGTGSRSVLVRDPGTRNSSPQSPRMPAEMTHAPRPG